YQKTVDTIQETVDGYPGLVRDVQTYLKERIKEVLTGTSEAVVIQIFGPDLGVLRGKAEEVRQTLSQIDGIVDLHTELLVDIPHVQVKVDLARAAAHGVKPGDVRRAAATLMAGEEVGDIFRDGKAYDIQVWSKPEIRRSLSDIRELLLDTPAAATCAWPRSPTWPSSRPQRHRARGRHPQDRRRSERPRPRPGRGHRRRRGPPGRRRAPPRLLL
ncbi:MAG TPA: efflux RND transporter permease subunit, partial [Actinomycetota bacterium]|nr:efflux RND transporter permease subunit [Actinomycetota bacterium]